MQTLLSKQMTTLVEPGRTVKSGGDPIAKLGKSESASVHHDPQPGLT